MSDEQPTGAGGGRAPLDGQVALVTGAASGIGRASARRLAADGAAVAVNRLPGEDEAAAALLGEIRAAGGEAIDLAADVSEEAAVEAMFAEAVRHFGTLDIVVPNAGIQRDARFAEMRLEDWRRVLDVNLTGQFLCARAAVREFLREGRPARPSRARGKIVFMSSVHQRIPWAGHVNYAASKGGAELLMASLAQEVAGQGIRVNAVAPGAIETAINREVWQDSDARAALVELIPYGRLGAGEDIANAVAWLVSDQADYVCGTTLFVDGGLSLYPAFRDNG